MKEILDLIQNKKQEFAQLDLFKFFQDTSITATDKISWIPNIAPLVMEFAELNKTVFRKEPADNKLQEIINKHTYDDENHWEWFLEDIEILGINTSFNFTDTLRFLWSQETRHTRKICQQITIHTYNADNVIIFLVIESLEAAFEVSLSAVSSVIEELGKIRGQEYSYFGNKHAEIENNHLTNHIDVKHYIESIELTVEQRIQAHKIVNLIFQLLTDSMNELIDNVRKNLREADYLNQQQVLSSFTYIPHPAE